MPRKIPEYLRLHSEESNKPAGDAPWPELEPLIRAFQQATGWQLVARPAQTDGLANEAWSMPVRHETATARLALIETADEDERRLDFDSARLLGKAFGEILSELGQARDALWEREAELAAGVPVISHSEEQTHLAARLDAVLKCGAEAVGCEAAALYLLDDATSELKLRACWGLPKQHFVAQARPLRGAVADLEALVGHAVAVSDLAKLSNSQLPGDFATALCVPVSTPTTPLGTLWFFSSQPREYTQHQNDVAEIVAGRLAADLEREVLLGQGLDFTRLRRQQESAVQWQYDRRPTFAPLLDELQLADWVQTNDSVARGFHDWNVLPEGRVTAAVGQGRGEPLAAALTAAAVHASLRSHTGYPHSAGQLMGRLNETLWQSSVGGQFASLGYATIDPESSKLQWSAAGSTGAFLITTAGMQLLSGGPELGAEATHAYREQTITLKQGEVLVLASDALWQNRDAVLADRFLLPRAGAGAENIAAQWGEWIAGRESLCHEECRLIVVRRR